MSSTDAQLALSSGNGASPAPGGVFNRAQETTGWRSWVTTVDHKRIGIMYGAAALFFFIIGGAEAMLIRLQLARPDSKLLSADLYNQIFTMHGTTMIFLVVMPIGASFMNYLIPLQIGAWDVAFPRLNALSFWVYLAGGIVLNSAWLLGGGADGGWFNYAPNNGVVFSPSHGIDFWNMGLILTGLGSLLGAVNLITTVLNLRAPGMTLMKMPVFTWMALVTQFMMLFAIPALTSAQVLLAFDRLFGARIFDIAAGGDALLWQHLFWIFGHPEVYIMMVPAFGIVSEIIPTFSRQPIFGYPFMVFSGIAIGFMGWGVWAHHMFASGIGPISVAAFSISTMFIAVPTGVKILNWLATMWGGKIRYSAAMLYAVGLVTMFTIGGLSGVTHAIAPADTQQTDTYYIVAHFHYVLFGGALFGFVGGWWFWWPKAFGYKLSELHGKINFWFLLLGFNLTFGPMHILGLEGMPRRTYTYRDGYNFNLWNMVATIGAAMIGISFLYLFWIIWSSRRNAIKNQIEVGPDPWDARSLEWSIQSPVPAHNFDYAPTVRVLDDFWYRKYQEDESGTLVPIATAEELAQPGDGKGVHLPSPSFWPIVMSVGLGIVAYGLIYTKLLVIPGGILVVAAFTGWANEPSVDPRSGVAPDDDPEPSDEPDAATPDEEPESEAATADAPEEVVAT